MAFRCVGYCWKIENENGAGTFRIFYLVINSSSLGEKMHLLVQGTSYLIGSVEFLRSVLGSRIFPGSHRVCGLSRIRRIQNFLNGSIRVDFSHY